MEESRELGQGDGEDVRQLRQEDSVVKQLAGLVSQSWAGGGAGAVGGGDQGEKLKQDQPQLLGGVAPLELQAGAVGDVGHQDGLAPRARLLSQLLLLLDVGLQLVEVDAEESHDAVDRLAPAEDLEDSGSACQAL